MAEDALVYNDIFFGGEDVFVLDEKAIEEASRKIFSESTFEGAFDNIGRKTTKTDQFEAKEIEITINPDQVDFSEGMDLIFG